MATPSNRVPVRIARGTKTNLDTAMAAGDLKEGEICYATDENGVYVVEGGVLTQAGADLAATSIDALSDVDTTTTAPTDGQVLTWVDANGAWEPADGGGGGGGGSLASLSDVNTTSAVEGDLLQSVGLPPVEKLTLPFDSSYTVNIGSGSNLSGPSAAVGVSIQGTTVKYGAGALKINGKGTTASARLGWYSNSSTAIEGDDFTLEAWIYITVDTVVNDDAYTILARRYTATLNNSYAFQYYPQGHTSGNGGKLSFLQGAITADGTQYFSDAVNMSANTWHHVAVVKVGTDLTFYFNGVAYGTRGSVGNCPNVSNGGQVGNMNSEGSLDQIPGDFYIDDLSVSDTAKYTADFTPSQNLSYSSLEWTATSLGIGDLGDVDAAAPANGDALLWSSVRSQWEATPVPGATVMDELKDAAVPDLVFTSEFMGRADTDAGTFPSADGQYWAQSDQERFWLADVDSWAQDLFTFYPTVDNSPEVVGKYLRVATTSSFTTILFEFKIDKYDADTVNNRISFETNDTSIDVSLAGGTIYYQTGTYTATFADKSRLAWNSATNEWVPMPPSVPDTEIPEISVSLLNFDYAANTGENYAPVTDDYATAVDGLSWSGVYNWNKIVASPVKFGIGAYELLTGVIAFPDSNVGEHDETNYNRWAPRWALGDSDFTMEFWWYYPSGQNTADRTLVCWGDSVSHSAIRWEYESVTPGAEQFIVYYTPDGLTTNTVANFPLGAAMPEDVWTHVAICREGANLRAFVNGTQVGTDHNIGSTIIKTPSYNFSYSQFRLGGNQSNSVNSRGHIDGWRYVKKALYTSSFTAPTSAPAAVGYDDGTILAYSNGAWRPSTDHIPKSTLQAEVAASTDFADFQTRIAAL